MMNSSHSTLRRTAGFTLIEMMVVVVIIGILATVLLPALFGATKKKNLLLASEQVKAIHAAATMYYEQFGVFPPDTDSFDTGDNKEIYFERESIYRYLGKPINDKATGKVYGPYLNIKMQFLKDEIYMDPWGQPFEMDSLHVTVNKGKGPKQGDVERMGAPYPPGTDEEKQILDLKAWSGGPDKKWQAGSNVITGVGTEEYDQDNVISW